MIKIDGIEYFTEQELHQNYRSFLRHWKNELKAENLQNKKLGYDERKFNFSRFKQNCRDRKHNALAGHCKTKDGLYFWYSDKY